MSTKIRGMFLVALLGFLGYAAHRGDVKLGDRGATALVSSEHSRNPGSLEDIAHSKIVQLTFSDRQSQLGDPFVEYQSDGRVLIYGTSNGSYLEYANEDDFLHGRNVVQKMFRYQHSDKTPFTDDETPWDLNHLRWVVKGKPQDVFYAGTMDPPPGKTNAVWPDDNITRRSRAFLADPADPSVLVEVDEPIFKNPDGSVDTRQWIGHNYGRDFIKGEDGKVMWDHGSVLVAYERIGRMTDSGKLITEIAARKMSSPFHAEGPEVLLLSIDDHKPYPAVIRNDGGLLMEGPRIIQMRIGKKLHYVMGFSSGEFPTNHYGMNLAVSDAPFGPYHAILNADRSDLFDLAADVRTRYQLTFGPGRPNFFKDAAGNWWIAFHAVKASDYPGHDFSVAPERIDDFFENLFLVRVQVTETPSGELKFVLLDH